MIARALLINPMLLVADEPVSMLDATLRSGILKLLMKLRDERGLSILFITHDMGLAHYVSDRILVMYKGRIVEEGTPNEIIESPKHPYTKRLIYDIPLLYRKWGDI
ncbi:MAG: ABC transporter ATP-binding protein [Ignisphaera sp.]